MASASPTKHRVKPSRARTLKNPASWKLLRKNSWSDGPPTLNRLKDLFFIFLGLGFAEVHSSGIETLLPSSATTSRFMITPCLRNPQIQNTARCNWLDLRQ